MYNLVKICRNQDILLFFPFPYNISQIIYWIMDIIYFDKVDKIWGCDSFTLFILPSCRLCYDFDIRSSLLSSTYVTNESSCLQGSAFIYRTEYDRFTKTTASWVVKCYWIINSIHDETHFNNEKKSQMTLLCDIFEDQVCNHLASR